MLWAGGLYGARPFTTDDAGTVAQGIHELELGVDFLSEEVTPGLSFKHGLTERMDLGVGVGYTLAPEENVGFGNAELGLKFSVVPDLFAFSVIGSFGHEEYILNGIITRNLGPVEIDANFGYETGSAVDEDDTVIYALAAIFNAGPHAFGVEGAGDKDGLYSWLVGGRYTLLEGIAIDAGITGGFEEDAVITATAGLHCEF
jgi:hypothetical protein